MGTGNFIQGLPLAFPMHITIATGENVAIVKLKHEDDHVPYWCIDVPADVKTFVVQSPNLNPTQAGHAFGYCINT